MAKRYNDSITVYTPKGRRPFFVWRGRRYDVVRILSHWKAAGTWWKPQTEKPELFSVLARPYREEAIGMYELCYDQGGQTWRLLKVAD